MATPSAVLDKKALAKWKARMRNRVRSILKRLEKLENVLKVRKSEIREAKQRLAASKSARTRRTTLVAERAATTKSVRRARRPTAKPVVVVVKSTLSPMLARTNQMVFWGRLYLIQHTSPLSLFEHPILAYCLRDREK